MNKTTRIVLKTISTLIVIIVVSLAFLLVGIKMFGVEIYAVLSGSMKPTYQVGSIIYVVEVDTEELKKGDPVTYRLTDNTIATHRIIEIEEKENGKLFYTKGDANDLPDESPVSENEIIGKPIFTIPLLGYIAYFMQTTHGFFITVGVGILLVVLVFVIDGIADKKKDNKDKKEKQENN